MDTESAYRRIQSCLSTKPLIITGTGASIPLGIPGMAELSAHLCDKIDRKHSSDANWMTISSRLHSGMDLESAISDLMLSPSLINDIRIETWNLINYFDLALFNKVMLSRTTYLPLSRLLMYYCNSHPRCTNIITTNYDRSIEYACDLANLTCKTGYEGFYCKSCDTKSFTVSNAVNIVKVHGSLDTFLSASGLTVSIPIQPTIPSGHLPAIVIPGQSKFRAVLVGPNREFLHKSDELISNAYSYMCIGYGFNDEQIQENIIKEVRKGKNIVVITKKLTPKAEELITVNAHKHIIIQEGINSTISHLIINGDSFDVNDCIWTIDGLLKLIE